MPESLPSHIGQVYWITGLAGAGKTTIAKEMYIQIKENKPSVVLLDGDMLREALGSLSSYTTKDRLNLAMQYAKLCKLLSSQGLDVVCATISMFDRCREWNRLNLLNYFEIYLKVNPNELQKRDQKELYSQALNKKIKNVVGIDLPYEEPKKPDLIIQNDGRQSIKEICKYIFNYLTLKGIK